MEKELILGIKAKADKAQFKKQLFYLKQTSSFRNDNLMKKRNHADSFECLLEVWFGNVLIFKDDN